MVQFKFDEYTKKDVFGLYKEEPREIPIIDKVDVLVVGGSPSGVAAAVSAARNGANVILVERFGFLGGQSVFGLVTQWEKRAFINNLGAVATKGIAKEILDEVVDKGNSDGLWETPPGCPEMRDGEEWLDVHDIKLTLLQFCEEAGVEILFHTMAVDVILEPPTNNERIELPRMTGVIFENKTGRFAYKAKTVIDATADLDLVWKGIGEKGCVLEPPGERIGAGFYIYYGGVDTKRFIEYVLSTDTVRGYPDPKKFPDKLRKHFEENKLIKLGGFQDIFQKAEEKGLFERVEEIFEPLEIIAMLSLGMKWVGRDRWCVPLTGIQGVNLLDLWELSKYEAMRTKLEDAALHIVREIPGWEDAYIDRENLYMGSRQTRILKAKYMLTKKDIFDPDHERKDVIGRSGAHDPGKNKLEKAYPIPYGIIVPEKLDGTLVCCRSVGCAERKAIDAHRGITPTMVVGQAAGTAAALSVKNKKSPHNIDLDQLKEKLKDQNVLLDLETVEFDFETPK